MDYSKDAQLGERVHQQLLKLGIETPCEFGKLHGADDALREKFRDIMQIIGLDLTDDSLAGTPDRMAKMFSHEIFYGLNYDEFPSCTLVKNHMRYDEMVIERNIQIHSYCEHHMVAIDGVAHIGYIPKDKVVGLSKLNRIVDFFARRPQIQERLTAQVAETLKLVLQTEDVMVVMSCSHHCVRTRGIMDACSDTVTSKIGGMFQRDTARAEFLSLLKID